MPILKKISLSFYVEFVMAEQKNWFTPINEKLGRWLADFKQQELLDIGTFVNQAKEILSAAESLSQEQITQFTLNLQNDLSEFYQQNLHEAKHSIYLAIMEETLWQTLSEMTDKSQVEWAELQEDFQHKGKYKTGDIIGFGILECQLCHKEHHYTHCTEVSNCLDCGHHDFVRKPLSP